MSLHWFNLFLLLKLRFCGKMDDRMRILTKCSLLHSTDSIATPKRQNAYERDFVHSYKQQRDLLYLSSHAFDRIIRILLTHYCIELLGKGCNDTFWLHLRPCMLYCYGRDCTESSGQGPHILPTTRDGTRCVFSLAQSVYTLEIEIL